MSVLSKFRKHMITAVSKIMKLVDYADVFIEIENTYKKYFVDGDGKPDVTEVAILLAKYLPVIYGCINKNELENRDAVFYCALMLLKTGRYSEANYLFVKSLEILNKSPSLFSGDLAETIVEHWSDCIAKNLGDKNSFKSTTYLETFVSLVADNKVKATAHKVMGDVWAAHDHNEEAIVFYEEAQALNGALKLTKKINDLKKQVVA